MIRWLGPISDDALIETISTELQTAHRALHGQCLFRVVMFAHKIQNQLSLKQLTFQDIADFLVRVRAPSWEDHGFGSRSPHNQWHPFIKDIWKIADPQVGADLETKVKAILDLLEKAAEGHARTDSERAKLTSPARQR